MRFDPPLIPGTLLRRYKRFLADIRLDDGREVIAHCPNPGSMKTCAEPGWRVWVSPATNPARKLKWTLEIVLAGEAQVPILVNTARPNGIVHRAIAAGEIPALTGYAGIRTEVPYGENSRIDLLLTDAEDGGPNCYVEVKNVTLLAAAGRVAFPDSVTKRGAKHMAELARMSAAGHRAVVFFLVSRMDATEMVPADDIDPNYGRALRDALDAGVEAVVHRAVIDSAGVGMGPPIPLRL
jgi:sugar fermentation stimulation protein A